MVEWLAREGQTEGIGGRDEVDDFVEELMTEVQKGGCHKGAGADADGLGVCGSHAEKWLLGGRYRSISRRIEKNPGRLPSCSCHPRTAPRRGVPHMRGIKRG